jgi:hypothetical protein
VRFLRSFIICLKQHPVQRPDLLARQILGPNFEHPDADPNADGSCG